MTRSKTRTATQRYYLFSTKNVGYNHVHPTSLFRSDKRETLALAYLLFHNAYRSLAPIGAYKM